MAPKRHDLRRPVESPQATLRPDIDEVMRSVLNNRGKEKDVTFNDVRNTSIDNVSTTFNEKNPPNIGKDSLQVLSNFLDGYTGQLPTAERTDALFQLLLQLIVTGEQRGYDEKILKEQRLYDSPMSQLLRLMSTGMSRDAALQALTGVTEPALVGSGSNVSAPSTSGASGTARTQAFQAAAQGLSALGSLVGMGFSLPQAIQQTNLLKAQAFLTDDQLKKYNAVNNVTSAINSAISAGGDVATALKGFTDANQVRDYINENKDNPYFAPLFANGSFQETFGSTVGREFFNNAHFQSVRGDTEGQRLYNQVQKEEFDKSIAGYTAGQLQYSLQMFIDTYSDQVTLLENAVKNSTAQLEINGQILDQQKIKTWYAQQNKDITEDYLNSTLEDGTPVKKGISMNAVLEFWKTLSMNQVEFGSPEARQRYIDTLNKDLDFALTVATIKENMYGYIADKSADFGAFTTANPGFFFVCNMMQALGYFDLVNVTRGKGGMIEVPQFVKQMFE